MPGTVTRPSGRLRLHTPHDLAAALDRDLLTVLYQPITDLRSGAVAGAEALVRLREPSSGALVPPADFMALAEASGLVTRIDEAVRARALAQAAVWRAGRPGRPFVLAVNVSVHDLADPALPERVAVELAAAGMPAAALALEVTETMLCDAGPEQADVVRRLAALGAAVTLDDFGTGFSSLSHLARFDVSCIKIDRSFVAELDGTGRASRVAGALVRLGTDLDLRVVAEGIETHEQLARLRELGCHLGQGYLLGRPLTAEQFHGLLAGPQAVPRPRAG